MKKYIIYLIISLLFLVPMTALSAPAYNEGGTDSGIIPANCLGDAASCGLCDVIKLVVKISDLIVGFSGAVALLMIIAGGMMLIVNYGNEARIKMGKEIIIAAIVGLFIVFLSWSIVNLVIFTIYGGKESAFSNLAGFKSGGWSGPCNPGS